MSRSRAERWEEEVEFLKAEMCRVLINFQAKARWWRALPGRRLVEDDTARRGMEAYAHEQAHQFEQLSLNFASRWREALDDNKIDVPSPWPVDLLHVGDLNRRVKKRRDRTNIRKKAAIVLAEYGTVTPPSSP